MSKEFGSLVKALWDKGLRRSNSHVRLETYGFQEGWIPQSPYYQKRANNIKVFIAFLHLYKHV